MNSLQPVIRKLEDLFHAFNNRFYNGSLPTPVITISPDTTTGAYGWCTSWKAWTDKDNSDPDAGYYEINICSEYLSRPFKLVAETLLHEMAHLYNLQRSVNDTSRSGMYHNKKYKEAAEGHGLTVDQNEKYGWCETSLNAEAEAFVEQYADKDFDLVRRKVGKGTKGSKKQSSRKYICPCCGLIIRATKPVNVLCMDCNEQMIAEATEDTED